MFTGWSIIIIIGFIITSIYTCLCFTLFQSVVEGPVYRLHEIKLREKRGFFL